MVGISVSLIGLFVLRPDLLFVAWFSLGIAPPGILYLVYWRYKTDEI